MKKIIKDGILAETGSPYFSCLASDKANRTTGFDMINSGYNAQYNLMATCALEDATTVNAGVGPIFDTDCDLCANACYEVSKPEDCVAVCMGTFQERHCPNNTRTTYLISYGADASIGQATRKGRVYKSRYFDSYPFPLTCGAYCLSEIYIPE
ncbi:Oidioi.mRNA.OKI2018_I69.PAR.g8632.t1.cds [Oikopleura dioica]|uniref:Oidioi.mRNA.OKI2018_I69.PAR.g8632.t1.cds n=1 Tax=Oikopleura dioica TaxID=34765 RepID=A0ABN7RLC7_OIKDI|nr:Oidioi.mRNA.OKI2018_I69.PAR.g8632.t1.cds [Oikopleura dioica]